MKILILKARHFKEGIYVDNQKCPLAIAAIEKFKTKDVGEGVTYIRVGALHYGHYTYWHGDYVEDYNIAKGVNFNNTIIRKIKLT